MNIKISNMSGFIVIFLALLSTSLLHAENSYTVKANDNLDRIVGKFYKTSKFSRSQKLVAILAVNPNAFKRGNVNSLILGKKLKLPDENDFLIYPTLQANKIIRQHGQYLRKGKKGNLTLPSIAQSASGNQKQPEALLSEQKQQLEKLNTLQNESEELRIRLDKLIAEKKASDEKFEEVERALQESLKQSTAN